MIDNYGVQKKTTRIGKPQKKKNKGRNKQE